jgi:pimeloyl-ACP methyl ester carboxylesterase
MQKKWYDTRFLINLLLLLFFPIGLYALWKSTIIAKWWKVSASLIITLIVIIRLGPYDSSEYVEPKYDTSMEFHLGLERHELLNNNCKVNYWIGDNNKEKWVVFLHGARAPSHVLDQVSVIKDNYNVLLIDRRGQGNSKMIDDNYPVVFSNMIGDVIQIMDANNIDQTILLAQSL